VGLAFIFREVAYTQTRFHVAGDAGIPVTLSGTSTFHGKRDPILAACCAVFEKEVVDVEVLLANLPFDADLAVTPRGLSKIDQRELRINVYPNLRC